ncbi:MAG: hypothetical protein DWQ02_15830 [Bacteroidetes bacterium]|nr:MAG: hypothetical protein DWQ02_15830 [Bacteroidota bacterium]
MDILGISAFYHDSAAAIIRDGELIAAAQEERFSRVKHDARFPLEAIKFCLQESGTTIDQLEAIVFYDKPLLKFERILETYYAFAPKGVASFVSGMPVWLKEKLFLKNLIRDQLKQIQSFRKKDFKLLFSNHHLSHAASAFYLSAFDEAAVLTIDGVGEWSTASIWKGRGSDLIPIKTLNFPHSLGLLYAAFTYWLGFKVNSGEYKVMGLAPYGNSKRERVQKFVQIIKEKLIKIYPDGSLWLNQNFFTYSTKLRMVDDSKWSDLFGIARRKPDSALEPVHCDLALAIQMVTEEVVIKMAREAKRLTGASKICLAGGVALNGVANGKLLELKDFEDVFIQPASGDAGGAPGAALAVYHQYFGKERLVNKGSPDGMQGTLLGPEFSDLETQKQLRKYNVHWEEFKDFGELSRITAEKIQAGEVVGWFQGKMEFGPRALGNRSILGNPADPEMQQRLNLKIKKRESFRPFAPSVLESDAMQYFNCPVKAPYMLLITQVSEEIKIPLPDGFDQLSWQEKLHSKRSKLPAVTHVDYSARLQTVSDKINPRYWTLINHLKQLTEVGVVVNTSFNVRGEPIVCSPEDAYKCFMTTDMDYLVIGNLLLDKQKQGPFLKAATEDARGKITLSEKQIGESSLVITAGFIGLWFLYKKDWFLITGFSLAVLSLISNAFARILGTIWMWIAHQLGRVMPKLILGVFYFLFLTPLALIQRVFRKENMDLFPDEERISLWKDVEKQVEKEDFEKLW